VDQQNASILVVDDEPNNFDVIEILLSREGYSLDYAPGGREAFRYLEKHQPDIILLDVMMPELDGMEVCRQLKSNTTWQHIPVVMVTALSSKEDLAQCLEAGADDFVGKPISSVELRARVRSMLRIKQQYDDLKDVLKLREDLSNMLVHDLRNPLASIFLACDLLELTNLQSKQQQKVEQIQLAGQQLDTMIDSLLIFAKLESGKFCLKYVEVDLCQLGQKVIQDFKLLAAQKNIQLISDLPEPGQTWRLDAAVFRRVLDNLLSNAIKFSPGGSQVILKIDYPTPNQARIQVADAGKGVSSEAKQQIFEKFEIGSPVEEVSQTGLGLAFCKMAIAAHGGTISVEDNQPRGSIFKVELTQDL
jgi:signal transduction histidine kinase